MADQPLGGESAAVIYPDHFPPAAAARIAFKLLNRHSPHEISEAIHIMMDVLDFMDGDPDAEDDDPAEATGDEKDMSWPNRIEQDRAGPNMGTEDDEADDHAGQCDEDGINTSNRIPYLYGGVDHSGPGCPISDEVEPDWRHLRKVKPGEDHGDSMGN